MLFWNKNTYNFLIVILSLIPESALIFSFAGIKPLVIMLALTPLYVFLSYSLKENFNFQTHVAHSLFFYLKFVLASYTLNYFFPNMYTLDVIKSAQIGSMAFSLNLFTKMFGFISIKKKNTNYILLCSDKFRNFTHNLDSSLCKVFYSNHYSLNTFFKTIEKEQKKEIFVDTLQNFELALSHKSLTNHKISCIECGNQDILKYFFAENSSRNPSIKDESAYFSGAKVLIIGNNESLIKSFIVKSLEYDCHSIILLSDSSEICENFSKICRTIHYGKDFKFKEMESKFQVDIIFDTFIIKTHNFATYRAIAKDLSENIKNKKAIISLKQKGVNVEDWLLNSSKELIVKKLYDNTFGLTAMSYTIGEFEPNTSIINIENPVIFEEFYIQNVDEIASKSWYLINNIEKSSFNSVGNITNQNIKSERFIRLLAQSKGVQVSYETFEAAKEEFELINSLFIRYKVNFSHFAKSLTEEILEKNPVNYEDIARAIMH